MIRFLRLLFLLVGIWILILTIPLSSPSSLTNIITSGGINHQVTINTPILNSSLIVSGTQMFFCMLLFSICLVCVSPSGRRNFFGIIHSPKRSISILLPLTIFIFALYPTQNGLPIVLYLTLSTLGLLSILFGAYLSLIHI